MKNNTLVTIILLAIAIGITSLVSNGYHKTVEEALIATYQKDIDDNEIKIADYKKQNEIYQDSLRMDSITIAEQIQQIQVYEEKGKVIEQELSDAKNAIKDYTAGEAISAFVDHIDATDSKMLVQDADTSLIVTTKSIKKAVFIFTEHKFQKLQLVNLSDIINTQSTQIVASNKSIASYRSLVDNKDLEVLTLSSNLLVREKQAKLELDKVKAQRDKARLILGGVATAAVPIIILLLK